MKFLAFVVVPLLLLFAPRASAGDVDETLTLARRTLEFVQKTGPRGEFARQLAKLEARRADAADARPAQLRELADEVRALRRRIIFSHPALDFDKLLINKRHHPGFNHMCDQYLGRHSQVGPGLVVLESWKDAPRVRPLFEGELPVGEITHPDLSFDGKRVLFVFCDHSVQEKDQRRFCIYEANLETGDVRQVTGTATDTLDTWEGRQTVLIEDFDPCYLPDGGMAFVSTRCQTFGRCHGTRYTPVYLLFRGELDGTGIRQISFGEANEWDPSVLHDGRLVYTRWDYINRHDTIFQSLWVTRPDGSATEHFYGNYTRNPCMIAETLAIPGSHKVVATATAHHGYTHGSTIVVDPLKGRDGEEPLTRITPEVKFPETERGRGRYVTPYPLNEDLFLVSYLEDSRYAIYLVDTLGGRELVYRDASVGCYSPIPLRPRTKPPVIRPAAQLASVPETGTFYLQDIYESTESIEPGSIKSLRINRLFGQPTRAKPALSLSNNEIIKGIIGTVPVDENGSVAFQAPAGVPLQFQALDENGMAVMTMRSSVYLQAGEVTACVGCHESRRSTPVATIPQNVQVHTPKPPAGPQYAGGFSFARSVQPVLDRYCIDCHGLDSEIAGGINLLGTPTKYNTAHDALTRRKDLVAIAYRNREHPVSRPKDYFAHAGGLAELLLEGHEGVELDRESFERIVAWLDLNAQYYGDYSFNREERRQSLPEGERALRAQIEKLFGPALAKQPFAALVNVALPSESRILKAPLAAAAGGWEQIAQNGWKNKNDAGYRTMQQLVAAAIRPLEAHDVTGTCGRDACQCGVCWLRAVRESRKRSLNSVAKDGAE